MTYELHDLKMANKHATARALQKRRAQKRWAATKARRKAQQAIQRETELANQMRYMAEEQAQKAIQRENELAAQLLATGMVRRWQ